MEIIINAELVGGPEDGKIIQLTGGTPVELLIPCTVSAQPHNVIYEYRREQGSGNTIKYDFKEYRLC